MTREHPDETTEADVPASRIATDGGTDTPEETISEEEQEELIQEIERKRSIRGTTAAFVALFGVLFSLYQMWLAARSTIFRVDVPLYGIVDLGSLQALQARSIHVTFALVLAFLLYPPSTGDGRFANACRRFHSKVVDSTGAGSPLATTSSRVGGFLAWFAVDEEMERVTPLDVVSIVAAIATSWYMVMDFGEIRQIPLYGLQSMRPIQEVFTFLALPVELISLTGLPLDEFSYAYLLAIVGVLLVLEATRRALGLFLSIIVSTFIVYAKMGHHIPGDMPYLGVLSIPETGWADLMFNLWYTTNNGVFGVPVEVSVKFIYIFVLFGGFLEMSGAGQWFIDLAYAATGTRKGGSAKSSVLASGFMGTLSGSSIANTVTTGAFTIPLMKKSGYRAEFAGAVEASASSGGQILPPVMGAAAFLIVEFTGTPYPVVITAAAIPAIVFFFGVWVMVHLEAARTGVGGVSREELVDLKKHLQTGWFYLIPILLLLYYLVVERLTPARSAWFTIVAIIALIAFMAAYNRKTRVPLLGAIAGLFLAQTAAFTVTGVSLTSAIAGGSGTAMSVTDALFAAAGKLGWATVFISMVTMVVRSSSASPLLDYDKQVDDAAEKLSDETGVGWFQNSDLGKYVTFNFTSMESAARTATPVVVAVAAAGIIPGVVSVTGLGPNLTSLITEVAGGSLVILLLVTAVSSIILGMGMPTTVTYIILVSLLGPAIAVFDVPQLAAHLFILYFGVIADITPPVAVAAYAASGIAKSDQFQTGVEAFSLSLNKAIVPFAFVLTPGILLLRQTGNSLRPLQLGDVFELGYFLPEVVLPVAGVFVGVIGLAATVIGYLYTDVESVQRGLFALSALALMSPFIIIDITSTTLGLFGAGFATSMTLEIGLRLLGGALFALLVFENRNQSGNEVKAAQTAD
ncbi:TRAP transporter permease [Haloarchaeobius sp. TZWWS8]|uniref:TRAP transporter permease n=1 Tax=Haloarchaeobius sp. TZWWS8 TaxID=3446121 RepID=UPI003EBA1031